jgi:hypothetical protein
VAASLFSKWGGRSVVVVVVVVGNVDGTCTHHTCRYRWQILWRSCAVEYVRRHARFLYFVFCATGRVLSILTPEHGLCRTVPQVVSRLKLEGIELRDAVEGLIPELPQELPELAELVRRVTRKSRLDNIIPSLCHVAETNSALLHAEWKKLKADFPDATLHHLEAILAMREDMSPKDIRKLIVDQIVKKAGDDYTRRSVSTCVSRLFTRLFTNQTSAPPLVVYRLPSRQLFFARLGKCHVCPRRTHTPSSLPFLRTSAGEAGDEFFSAIKVPTTSEFYPKPKPELEVKKGNKK